MACCGKLPKGSFSNLKNTWEKKSNLNMNDWEPYPELKGPNCFPSENYCNCSNGDCASFRTNSPVVNNMPGVPNLERSISMEGFIWDTRSCCATPYNTLSGTWSVQKPYGW